MLVNDPVIYDKYKKIVDDVLYSRGYHSSLDGTFYSKFLCKGKFHLRIDFKDFIKCEILLACVYIDKVITIYDLDQYKYANDCLIRDLNFMKKALMEVFCE